MSQKYDVAIVGGGIAGSALAVVLARDGVSVAVVERERAFRDRVRGEWLAPWGVAEARRLGLSSALERAGAHPLPWNIARSGKPRYQATPSGEVALTFFHPALQAALLTTAAEAGATVVRPATVIDVKPGDAPTLTIRQGNETRVISARLLVGADGRGSRIRSLLGHAEHEHRSERLLAGVRLRDFAGSDDTGYFLIRPCAEGLAMVYPQGGGFARAYLMLPGMSRGQIQDREGFARFVDALIASGIPAHVLAGVKQDGPLATFAGSDSWIEQPFGDGLAVIGDAAGISDPTWGMGIALALRDARAFRDALADLGDVRLAAARYADERDAYYGTVRTVENWQSELLLTPGEVADQRRRKAASLWSTDPSRLPDLSGLGPEVDASEDARRRFFGEDGPSSTNAEVLLASA